eukprot:347036-Alexandrium_andersonii.AAC.1
MHVPPHIIDSAIHMWGQLALSRTTQLTPRSSCIAMPELATKGASLDTAGLQASLSSHFTASACRPAVNRRTSQTTPLQWLGACTSNGQGGGQIWTSACSGVLMTGAPGGGAPPMRAGSAS